MTINTHIKIFKDKRILLPRIEVAWEIADKIFRIKIGLWKWDVNFSMNF